MINVREALLTGKLAEHLTRCWCRETSATPAKWSNENPSAGQCAVTALVIQDLCGGRLMRGLVNGESHYWNRVDGIEIDFTVDQFGPGAITREAVATRDRDYVLSFPETAKRYEYLKARLKGFDYY